MCICRFVDWRLVYTAQQCSYVGLFWSKWHHEVIFPIRYYDLTDELLDLQLHVSCVYWKCKYNMPNYSRGRGGDVKPQEQWPFQQQSPHIRSAWLSAKSFRYLINLTFKRLNNIITNIKCLSYLLSFFVHTQYFWKLRTSSHPLWNYARVPMKTWATKYTLTSQARLKEMI